MQNSLIDKIIEANKRKLTIENMPYDKLVKQYRESLPKALRDTNNDKFFDFIDKMAIFENKYQFWLWVLETQFNVLTAKGKFLDNLGSWLGLSRPPIPNKRTDKPVVIFGRPFEKSGMSKEDYDDFVLRHNLTSSTKEGTQDSFFPLRDFIGETLVNDVEYRIYILGILRLKQGITFLNILNVFVRILVYPFYLTKNTPYLVEFTAHPEETENRLFIVREITYKLRTTGFNITLTQALSENTPEIKAIYGEDCWDRKNPILNTDKYLNPSQP